jgi:polysaccharide biosynthesis/export protein
VLLFGVACVLAEVLGGDAAKLLASPALPQGSSARQKAAETADQPSVSASKRVDNDYVIGPSDVLGVNVWKDTELTRSSVLVRPDGKISLPLVGELEVSGLTALGVQGLLVQKLKAYISNPQVTVIVQEVKSRTYIIMGKIVKAGSYELGKPTTILEAIAIAGGFQEFAKTNKIYVIRKMDDGSTSKLPFDYKNVIKGHHPEENVILKSGDTIVVP